MINILTILAIAFIIAYPLLVICYSPSGEEFDKAVNRKRN